MESTLSNCLKIALNLIFNEDESKIILVQEAKDHSRGLWFLPAGKGKLGELITETCIRETVEEAGVISKPKYLLKTEHIIRKVRLNEEDEVNYLDVFRFLFVSEAQNGNLKTIETKDSIKAEWVNVDDVKNLPLRSLEVLDHIELYKEQKSNNSLKKVTDLLEEYK